MSSVTPKLVNNEVKLITIQIGIVNPEANYNETSNGNGLTKVHFQ